MATTTSSSLRSSSSWWWWGVPDRSVGPTLAAILIPMVAGVLAAHTISMASSSSSSSLMETLLLSFSWRELGLVLSNILLLTYIAITIPPKILVSSRSRDSSTDEELKLQSTAQHDEQKLKQQEQDDKINNNNNDDDDDDTKDTDKGDGSGGVATVVDEKDIIHTIQELRDLMPAGTSHGSTLHDAKKILHGYLDEQMMAYIQRSPFVQLGTVDHLGRPYISPKGDAPGFVSIIKQHPPPGEDPEEEKGIGLILPDRPGNRLLFGLQNLLRTKEEDNKDDEDEKQRNPPTKQQRNTTTTTTKKKKKKKNYVSLLFEIPGMNTTLRVGGKNARISTNTKLLHDHMARRCVPKVVILIDIEYAFFHCSKAYMRSRLWTTVAATSSSSSVSVSCSTEKIVPIATATTNTNATMNPGKATAIEDASLVPGKDTEFTVGFGRYFAPKNSFLANVIDNDIDDHYKGVQKAIDGDGKEMEQQ